MADLQRLQLTNIQNVAASKTAIIELPSGNVRLHMAGLLMTFGGGTNSIAGAASNVLEIRIRRNGKTYYQFSGTELRDLNLVNGTAYDFVGATPNTTPTAIPIYFAEPWRMDEDDQLATCIVVAGARWTIEVDLGAGTTPTLTGFVVMEPFTPLPNAQILYKKIVRDQCAASGVKYSVPGFTKRDMLQWISIYPDSGGSNQPSKVTLKLDSTDKHDLTYAMNNALNVQSGMTPTASGRTANVYDLQLDHDGWLQHAVNLDNVTNLLLQIESASAMSGSQTYLVQRIGPAE